MTRPRTVAVPSFAKVNLGLEVLGPRADGYHELRTVFQTIALQDELRLRPRSEGVSISCDHRDVPGGEANLAWRAADELRREAGIRSGVSIRIMKRIPVGGGLGGGSSNAAAVLLALDRLWGLGLGVAGLFPVARRLGADVPFFLVGGTALGVGRGDEVYPLRRQVKGEVVLVPGRPVSTAAVFSRLRAGLTAGANNYTIFRFVSSDLEGVRGFSHLSNGLEQAALQEAPDLANRLENIRGILIGEGAVLASLSGSGSSFFGLFVEARRARRAEVALARAGFAAVRSPTLSLDQYRKAWSRSLDAATRARGWDQGRSGHHGDHGRKGHPRGRREAQGLRVDRV